MGRIDNRSRRPLGWMLAFVFSGVLAACAAPPPHGPPGSTPQGPPTSTPRGRPTTTTTVTSSTTTTTTVAPSTTTSVPAPPEPDGTIERISNGADEQVDGDSVGGVISADGRYIAFSSYAPDLVPDDTNFSQDVFVWDRTTSTMTRITDGDSDSHNPAISADGHYIAFSSWASDLAPGDLNGGSDVFVWDATTGATTRITDSAAASFFPQISADGRYITFYAFASNLVPDDTNNRWDVFVWDATTGTTTRITDGNEDSLDPTISADGRYIAFWSGASNLVHDTNGGGLFLWDATTDTISRIADGGQVPVISPDGRYVLFNRPGDSFQAQDVFVWDATTGVATDITHGNDHSYRATISADGDSITFSSRASNLVADDTAHSQDVFLWERNT